VLNIVHKEKNPKNPSVKNI
jgi:hypothetical protein